MKEVIKHEDRLRRAKYLGALADRLFRNECARLGLNADEAIKSPLLSIITRQGRRVVTNREKIENPDAEMNAQEAAAGRTQSQQVKLH